MSSAADYALFESLMAEAMRSRDPAGAIQQICSDHRLPLPWRKALASANADGIRLSAMLFAKLRFEMLMQGSAEAARSFERDPASFTGVFRRYHREVEPRAFFASDEGRIFEAWLEKQQP